MTPTVKSFLILSTTLIACGNPQPEGQFKLQYVEPDEQGLCCGSPCCTSVSGGNYCTGTKDPGNPCIECKATSGTGNAGTNVASGTACEDDDGCTTGTTCDGSGACGGGTGCSTLDTECQTFACASGSCAATSVTADTACTDEGLACTTDLCDGAGNCAHAVSTGCIVSNACSTDCGGAPVCGNGTAEAGEECDDNNTDPGDGCSASCTIEPAPVCGNSVTETGEQCDDGNTVGNDGCSSTCQTDVVNEHEHPPIEDNEDDGSCASTTPSTGWLGIGLLGMFVSRRRRKA